MNKILLLTLLALLAFGCSRKKVVEATYETGKPRIVRYYHKKGGELELDREIVYYKNEQKKMDGQYKDHLRNGLWMAWYENGNIWSEGEYNDGKRNGKGIAYHENGKKYIEGVYRNDIRFGVWRFYDTTGALTSEVNFDLVPGSLEKDTLQ
jgi:antitoxin component YwqK of YwqJK toxin-antitoxin module